MSVNIERFSAKSPLMEKFKQLPNNIYPKWMPEILGDEAQYWLALDPDEKAIARLSTQNVKKLHGVDGLSGLIGHYEALNEDAGVLLLKEAAQACTQEGAKRVIGPMNGSTWERYRLALPQKNNYPFFLGEPMNPPEYADYFINAGFIPVDTYESRITSYLTHKEAEAIKLQERLNRLGITIRSFDMNNYEKELEAIYGLSVEAFSHNRFYRDIPFERFKAIYDRLKPLLDPDYVYLAFDSKGKEIGFLMGYPDKNTGDFILKTIAVNEHMKGNGLGAYLFDLMHLIAHQKGYKKVIHALMHSDNVSLRLSKERYLSTSYRHYALYEWINLPK